MTRPANSRPVDILNNLTPLNLSACEVSICLASLGENDQQPNFERVNLTDGLLYEFRNVVRDLLEQCRRDIEHGDLIVQPYDAGSKPDPHEVEYINLSEHPEIQSQFAALSSLETVRLFSADDGFIDGLRFYVIALQPPTGEPIYCFRAYSKSKEITRSRKFAALFSEGQFDKLREPTFLFDHYIDCLCQGNDMFIFKKDNFQKIFRFFELLKAYAQETLDTIKASIPIKNFDDFATACGSHLQMQAKLKNIANKAYLSRVTVIDIKRILIMFPQLGIEIEEVEGQEMLIFNPKDKWAFLRLLDDDYLESSMTTIRYEVSGKREYRKAKSRK